MIAGAVKKGNEDTSVIETLLYMKSRKTVFFYTVLRLLELVNKDLWLLIVLYILNELARLALHNFA